MDAIQQMAAVALVLGMLGATLWWLRRRGLAVSALPRRSAGRRMEIVERVALGPQQTLHLLRFGERALLVASSQSGCRVIEKVAWQEMARPQESVR